MTSKAAQNTPPDSPVSPTASYYDLSDDEEGEYNTIMHSISGRGVKLLFSKSKVYFFNITHAHDKADDMSRSMYTLRHHLKIIFQVSLPSFSKNP